MTEQTWESLAQRLERLERENRWLKSGGAILGINVIAGALALGKPQAPKAALATGKIIETENKSPNLRLALEARTASAT